MLAALASFLDARHHAGHWLVRMDDIDPPREPEGAAEAIIAALQAFCLTGDEPILFQSSRHDSYEAALEKLYQDNHLYFCQCSRREIRERQAASPNPARGYDGWCRDRDHRSGALRVRTSNEPIAITDRLQPSVQVRLEETCGDFIVKRKDGLIAYQLACVVDDEFQQISHIVRGDDLWDNCPRQRWLQQLLGYREPVYLHLPVVRDGRGVKLSKQFGAPPINYENILEMTYFLLKILGFPENSFREINTIDSLLSSAAKRWNITNAAAAIDAYNRSVATQQIELL